MKEQKTTESTQELIERIVTQGRGYTVHNASNIFAARDCFQDYQVPPEFEWVAYEKEEHPQTLKEAKKYFIAHGSELGLDSTTRYFIECLLAEDLEEVKAAMDRFRSRFNTTIEERLSTPLFDTSALEKYSSRIKDNMQNFKSEYGVEVKDEPEETSTPERTQTNVLYFPR